MSNPNPDTSGLKPAKKGEPGRNKYGKNQYTESRERLVDFFNDKDPTPLTEGLTRFDELLRAAYITGREPGKDGAADRRFVAEQMAGKAKERVDVSNEDGSLRASVFAYIPDNGRGPRAAIPEQETEPDPQSEPGKPDGR